MSDNTFLINEELTGQQEKYHLWTENHRRWQRDHTPYCGMDRRHMDEEDLRETTAKLLLTHDRLKENVCLKCLQHSGLLDRYE